MAGWAWSSRSYDWQGRLTLSTNQDETTNEILYGGCGCAGGQVVVTRDEVGRRQKMTYDILGRLKTTQVLFIQPKNEPLNGNGAVYSTTTNTCNVRDQVTNVNVKDESSGVSQNTQMVYDGHGRLKERWLPIYLGNPQSETPYDSYEYHSDDTLMRVTDPRGASATYGYNNRHLVTSVTYFAPSGVTPTPNVTYDYDEAGNRALMIENGAGRTDYFYDTLSRLVREDRQFFNGGPAGLFTLRYGYNLAGNLTSLTDDRFGTNVTYNHNKAGELVSVIGSGWPDDRTPPLPPQFTDPNNPIKYRAWGG